MSMKSWDKNIYRFLLRGNFLLLILIFIIYPFKSFFNLSFINLSLVLSLATSFLAILSFAFLISIINIASNRLLIFPNVSNYLFYHIIYPMVHKLFKTQSYKYQKYSDLLIKYNNIIRTKDKPRFQSKDILILLPHCLQNVDCPYKITHDINNCHDCGKCVIQDLKQIQNEYDVTIKVATGGTIARKIIHDTRPKIILAVACHRDLTEGIKDIDVIPVVGVLNERPNGPCFNTTCDIDRIKQILNKIL